MASTKAELKQLQKERAEAHEKALKEAAEIAKLKDALGQPWDPRDDGFEFSPDDWTVLMYRKKLHEDAYAFRVHGRFPAPPPVWKERSVERPRLLKKAPDL